MRDITLICAWYNTVVRDITPKKNINKIYLLHALEPSRLYKYNDILASSNVLGHKISANTKKTSTNSFSFILGDSNQYLGLFLVLDARYCPILPYLVLNSIVP